VLAAKLESRKTSGPQRLPELFFLLGLVAAQASGIVFGIHGRSLRSSPGLNLTVSLSALTWRDWLIRFAVKRRRVSEPQRNREADQRAKVCPQRVFPFSAALFHAARLWTVPGNL
jgi:hypothetical protein